MNIIAQTMLTTVIAWQDRAALLLPNAATVFDTRRHAYNA